MLGRGRPKVKRSIGETRELTESDLQNLERAKLPAFKVFRDSYHAVARLVAAGLRDTEVASRSGYGVGRVHQLKADPTFMAVVEAYRQSEDESFRVARDEHWQVLLESGTVAARMQLDQLLAAQDAEEFVPYKDLNAIIGNMADRTGYGKVVTKKVQVDLADRLAQALAASAKVITTRPIRVIEEAGSNGGGGFVSAPAGLPSPAGRDCTVRRFSESDSE
jgi:hypothetical protein